MTTASEFKIVPIDPDEIPTRKGGGRNGTVLPWLQAFVESGVNAAEIQGMKPASARAYNKQAKANNLPVQLVTRKGTVYALRTES